MLFFIFFFFKQKTAYEMRISDWSSDVCSSDLTRSRLAALRCGKRPSRKIYARVGRRRRLSQGAARPSAEGSLRERPAQALARPVARDPPFRQCATKLGERKWLEERNGR